MTHSRKFVLNRFAESKKQLVTAQVVFPADKKEDKPGQDVVSLSILSEDINFIKHNPELLHKGKHSKARRNLRETPSKQTNKNPFFLNDKQVVCNTYHICP